MQSRRKGKRIGAWAGSSRYWIPTPNRKAWMMTSYLRNHYLDSLRKKQTRTIWRSIGNRITIQALNQRSNDRAGDLDRPRISRVTKERRPCSIVRIIRVRFVPIPRPHPFQLQSRCRRRSLCPRRPSPRCCLFLVLSTPLLRDEKARESPIFLRYRKQLRHPSAAQHLPQARRQQGQQLNVQVLRFPMSRLCHAK